MLKKNKSGRLLVVLVTIVIGDSPAVRLKMIPTVTNEAPIILNSRDAKSHEMRRTANAVMLTMVPKAAISVKK